MNFSLGNFPFNSSIAIGNFSDIRITAPSTTVHVLEKYSHIVISLGLSGIDVIGTQLRYGTIALLAPMQLMQIIGQPSANNVKLFVKIDVSDNDRIGFCSTYESTISDTISNIIIDNNNILLGQNSDGIFALNGDTDDGEDIDVEIKAVESDLDGDSSKVLVGVKLIGDVTNSTLLLSVNENEYTESPRYYLPGGAYFFSPTGQQFHYCSVGFKNENGSDFYVKKAVVYYWEFF